jgi:predicted transcriptional regulator
MDDDQQTDPLVTVGITADHSGKEIFNAKDAAQLLGITGAKLTRYLKDLSLDIPRTKEGLRITRVDLEVLQTYHQNRAIVPPGEIFKARDAARLLGITGAKLARYLKDLRLDISRTTEGLQITRADLEVLRIYHQNRVDGPRSRETQEAREFAEALKEYARIFRSLRKLTTDALRLEKRLRKAIPPGLAVIHTLPATGMVLRAPLTVTISPSGHRFRANFPEAGLEAMGATRDEALLELRQEIVRAYDRFLHGLFFREEDRKHFDVLKALVDWQPSRP